MSETPTRRLRIAHVTIQPVLMWDDGDNLEPGPVVEPQVVAPAHLASFVEMLPAEVARLAESTQ